MISDQPYATQLDQLSQLAGKIGAELGLTPWLTITQDRIEAFASATDDQQWIHVDAERSRRESPYGTTVAHGFLILSLASRFAYETYRLEDVVMGINYGLDKVRFPNATPAGARVRGRVSLLSFEPREKGARYKLQIVFELEGEEKPACVAEFIALAYTR